MKKIWIVEDDPVIREELRIALQNNGYIAATQTLPPESVKTIAPHLILLDVNLPGQNGFSFCTAVRALSAVPIIFVTSRDSELDELNAIALGGDDFIRKPYRLPVLLARIAAVLKRAYPDSCGQTLACSGVSLCLENGKVMFEGQLAELTKTEQKLLACLLRHAGQIVPRLTLISALWDEQCYIDDNTLSVHIARLRAKLAAIGAEGLITTKPRQGYIAE